MESFYRVRGIQGHIGPACLQDRQQANDHLKSTLHTDCDTYIGPDT